MLSVSRAVDLRTLLAKRSLLLLGPRQTGKTWMIREQLPEALTFNLLESDTYLTLSRAPRRLRELCTDPARLVVVDEVQKVPALLDEVHLLIEERRLRFLLTGSSARKLRRGGVNLLGGRARTLHLHPLTVHELGDRFDLSTALNRGLLPSVYLSDEPDQDLRAYAGDYLKEEIAAEGLTRNVPAFSRFLEVAALCNAQILNYTTIASDAQVARTTVQEFLQILRDTRLAFDLPPWGRTVKRKPVATAKLYFFDVGVVRELRHGGEVKPSSPELGHAFESWLHHELRAWADYHGQVPLHYWRSRAGHEVDFILGERTAIEAKASATVHERHLAGLRALREEGLLRDYVVACLETRPRIVDGIEILPWRELLDRLWAGRYA